MAEMAMQIIKKQPYALKDHPRTKGSVCLPDNSEHFEDWEINMVQKFNVSKRWNYYAYMNLLIANLKIDKISF